MKNHLTTEKAIGVSLEGQSLECCKIDFLNKNFTITELVCFDLEDVKPLDIEKRATLVLAVPSSLVLVRPLELPVTKEKDVEATFRFQLEPLLPFGIDESIIEKIKLITTKTSTHLLTFSCHKPEIQKILDCASKGHFDPEVLVPKPLSLYAFHNSFSNLEGVLYAIDVQEVESTCLLFIDGLLVQSRSLLYGVKNLEAAFSSVPQELEEDEKIEFLLPKIHEFFKELSRVLLSFQLIVSKVKPNDTEKKLAVTGPIVRYGVLSDVMAKFLDCQLQSFNFQKKCTMGAGITHEDVIAYASCVGTALLQSPFWIKKQDVNFRRQEFQYKDQFKRWKRPLFAYCSIVFVLFLTSLFFGNALISKKTKLVESMLENVIGSLYPERSEFEKAFCGNNSDSVPVATLSFEGIENRLEFIEDECRKSYEAFPLEPDIPRVFDVLSWLSARPQMQIQLIDEVSADPMVLQNFSYILLKRPEKGRINEHYQAQVTLEFTCQDPMLARQFHEDLLKPNEFIDPKGEIGWTQNKNMYRTSFYLKDRTKYSNYGGGN